MAYLDDRLSLVIELVAEAQDEGKPVVKTFVEGIDGD